MKKIAVLAVAGVLMCSPGGAFAADYTVAAPAAGIFGTPTSVANVVAAEHVNQTEVDKSKNSSLIPPLFGSPTSNLRGSGEPLTPNLATTYIDAQTKIPTVGTLNAAGVTVLTNTPQQTNPNVITAQGNGVYIPGTIKNDNRYYYEEEAFTKVTNSMYYSGGHLGTLKIPDLNVSVKIYEGTTNAALAKGVGHFKDTSIWNGNVCLASHNRGSSAYFGRIHELDYGDKITLSTKKGTRTYRVFNVEKISVNDTSNLQGTRENIITLITCVRNQADKYRWCVQAEAVRS